MGKAVEVWPENWRAWQIFELFTTQWRRAGMTGVRVGLDYAPIFMHLDYLGLTRQERDELFDDIRYLESEALSASQEE